MLDLTIHVRVTRQMAVDYAMLLAHANHRDVTQEQFLNLMKEAIALRGIKTFAVIGTYVHAEKEVILKMQGKALCNRLFSPNFFEEWDNTATARADK